MNNINLDKAVEYVKTLADNNRCNTCDQLVGPVARYPCGHWVCKACVLHAEDCLRCLSQPNISTNFTDVPQSQRVRHASELLTTFEDLFKLDVYKRKRLSDKLKLEKQFFPQCIQAPLKYSNRRKSSIITAKGKENLRDSFLPGESTSNFEKMDQKNNYIQQWLNENVSSLRETNTNLPRKPITDLNGRNNTKPTSVNIFDKENVNNYSRKRSNSKVFNPSKNKNVSLRLNKKKKDPTCLKGEKRIELKFRKSQCENDESGIFIDDNTVFEDTQCEYLDKDKLAVQAVKEAEESGYCDITHNDSQRNTKDISNYKNKVLTESNAVVKQYLYKVPFFKKSSLYKSKRGFTYKSKMLASDSKDVTFKINSKIYTTTIKISQCSSNTMKISNSKSLGIQTDAYQNNISNSKKQYEIINFKTTSEASTSMKNYKTIDLFKNNENTLCNVNDNKSINVEDSKIAKRPKFVTIEDSDSDSDIINIDNNILVTADVHSTSEDYGVLSALNPDELKNRMTHATRGYSPLSTDSSDKENYDPNRIKRQKIIKKCCSKK